MNLEQLTKHQIILLTLLVSFVTSIATGIVTVSLMNQAPPSVSHTIDQIVEHTIQTVTPATNQGATVVQTEKTVVVKDDDLVAQSVANLQKSVIRITAKGSDTLIARGIVIDARGTALTDKGAIEASGADAFDAILSDGSRVPVKIIPPVSSTTPVLMMSVAVGTSTAVAPATITAQSKLKLGQTVLLISGAGADTVGEGVIATLPVVGSDNIEASVQSSTPGSVITTLFGEVIGIMTSESYTSSPNTYTIVSAPAAPDANGTNSTSKP